jgi:hypothetical protein
MCGMAKSNPELTKDFLKQYARESKDLLSAEVFSSPGHFAGEAEFIQMIEDGYRNGDRHFTFEIKPAECALIVVDLQEDFVDPGKPMCVPEAYRQIPRVKSLIAGCRELGVPVVFTEHTIAEDCAGSYYEYWDDIADGATKEGAPNTAGQRRSHLLRSRFRGMPACSYRSGRRSRAERKAADRAATSLGERPALKSAEPSPKPSAPAAR